MPAAAPATASVAPEAVRIVLFGLPNAGKTSLLGALGQAARSQEHLLGGTIDDLAHGLEKQRHVLYDDQARATGEEIVPYAVAYHPSAGAQEPAVIMDC